MKKIYLLLMFVALAGMGFGQTAPGDIAIVAANCDGGDDFAFVALVDIPASAKIYFTDNEWGGSAFNDLNEGELTWTNGASTLSAGSIVVFTDPSSNGPVNIGTYTGSGWNLGGSDEWFYALLEAPATHYDSAPTFLAAFANDAGSGWLTGTGLTEGTNAIDFNNDYDGFEYTGSRTGESSFSDYLPLIYNSSNWQQESSNGENILPISTTAFTTSTSSNDTDSEVYDTGSQPSATNISSLADTQGEAVNVFEMTIEDAGTADGLQTHVTNIRVKPYSSNTADWTDNIQGVTLANGGSSITIGAPTITDTYIDIPISSGNLDIADGTSTDITMAVYLNSSNIADGGILSFMVDADDHGFTADASGSDFISPFTMGDFNSNDFTIAVEATQLSYKQQPTNVGINTVMSPDVLVAFTDANGNTDIDYDGAGFGISLTTTGTFSGSATTAVDATNGVSTFDNLIFSATGSGVTITANDDSGLGNTSAVSDAFDVIDVPKVIIARNCDPKNNYDPDRFAEIYNAGSSTVDLTNWTLENVQNGSVVFTWTLSGTIAAGETKVCARDDATNQTITPDFTATWSSGGSWNGKGGDGTILKNSGTVVDNAVQSDGTGTFENGQMKRKLSVTSPNATYTASEWTFVAVDDANDMVPGFHGSVWRGTGTVWSTVSNWDNGVPSSGTDITIPAGVTSYPNVDGTVTSPSVCNNLTVESGASLTIPVAKALTVSGTLTNNGTAAGLVVQSSSTGNGSLIVDGTISGDATVQRYIAGYSDADHGWHEICSPVDMTVASTGWEPGTSSPNLDDLYYWDEATNQWMGYKSDGNGNGGAFNFTQGQGYLVAYETTATKEFTGSLRSTSITYNNLSRDDVNGWHGWHLLGNPYSSAIEWNNNVDWVFTHIGNVPSVWDESGATYVNPAVGDPIPATNGFFVQVDTLFGGNNTFTIPASARVHNSHNNYKSTASNSEANTLKMTVTTDANTFYNKIRVGFKADATQEWDVKYDAHKMYGVEAAPELWTISNGEEFSVNTLPFNQQPVDLPLNFKAGADGNYTITFENIDSFDANSSIMLEDLFTGKTVDVRKNQTYSYTAAKEDAHNRFVLHFYNVTSTPEIGEANNKALIYSYNNNIIVKATDKQLNGKVEIINILGQTMETKSVSNINFFTINTNLNKGVYIVRYIETDGYTQAQKVIIN